MAWRGHQAVSAETIRACIGQGARVMIEEALRRSGAEDDVDWMLADFLVHYEANIAAERRPFPGAVGVLEQLKAQDATLVVCTNKREYLSRKLLQELDLADYFSGLAGRNTFPVSKPDPAHLLGTIELAGGLRRAVMVGDSDVDIGPPWLPACPLCWQVSAMGRRPMRPFLPTPSSAPRRHRSFR
jgi:phosphoglycolate phosphatase